MRDYAKCVYFLDWGLLMWCDKCEEQIFHPSTKVRFCKWYKTEEDVEKERLEEVGI